MHDTILTLFQCETWHYRFCKSAKCKSIWRQTETVRTLNSTLCIIQHMLHTGANAIFDILQIWYSQPTSGHPQIISWTQVCDLAGTFKNTNLRLLNPFLYSSIFSTWWWRRSHCSLVHLMSWKFIYSPLLIPFNKWDITQAFFFSS